MARALKEQMLKVILQDYCNNTNEGTWIIPLNPDNIRLEFLPIKRSFSNATNKYIGLPQDIEARDLFPCYIKELWHIKQKREHRWKYWFYKVFKPSKINDSADEKELLAKNWQY
jgi:hypothetical protein